jgi:hypothetical protein
MIETGAIKELDSAGSNAGTIPVHISYEIIQLFSEGLYQSPHKAIEELVSNGYDAGATEVHVLMPPEEPGGDEAALAVGSIQSPLWVIDNGSGMSAAEFFALWHVAHSAKANVVPQEGLRAPIGQFGIGKLAAYVLAWRLTHISRSGDEIHLTSMNFRKLTGHHLDDEPSAINLELRKIDVETAKSLLADVESRDHRAWELMFGNTAGHSWTAACLSDFKALYDRLSGGRLAWVLRTGLPLHSNFSIWLNGTQLESSKVDRKVITTISIGGSADVIAERLSLASIEDGVEVPGISGRISGYANLYQERLTTGKSEQYGRSNGFFIRVRGRVINLEDELFGLEALNHAAWSRFAMEVNADGLREHLLSSREGVRESAPIAKLRQYLHGVFNLCRQAFDEWSIRQIDDLDLDQILRDAPSIYVTEPLVSAVSDVVAAQQESFYIDQPEIEKGTTRNAWVARYAESAQESPFRQVIFEATGKYDRALHYIPETQTIVVNTDHPFIDKLTAGGKSRGHVTLFSSAEVFMDALMREHGIPRAAVIGVLEDRDRVLRLLAGDQPSTAAEVLRLLTAAGRNSVALERVVGAAFRVLGFEYERLGGTDEGPDGILYARLGRGSDDLADYKVVYDSKQTDQPAVPADKIKFDSLEDFRRAHNAQFGFFVAKAYAAEADPNGKLNRELNAATTRRKDAAKVTLLRIEDLKRVVSLHYRYGVTLTRLRSLFETAHTVPQVDAWIDQLEAEFTQSEPRVPLERLLDRLEKAKHDTKATPNVVAVRVLDEALTRFEPEKLIAALKAVQTIVGPRWIEVERSGEVRLHHTATQIVAEVERGLRDLFGVDPNEPNNPKG